MKQNDALRSMAAIVLALLVLLAAPAVLAAELPDGVSWDTTVEDMLALEGVTEDDDLFVVGGGDYTQYGFLRMDTYVRVAVYIFKAEGLVMYGYTAADSMQAEEFAFAGAYAELLASLTETYGEPGLDDVRRAADAANTVQEDAINTEDVTAYAGWDLGGGAMLYHLLLDSDGEETLYTIFVNESLLYAQ